MRVKNIKYWMFACISAIAAVAAQAAPQLDDKLRAALQSRVDSGELASVVVGISEGADTAIFGFSKSGSKPPDAQTVYEIGSVTKTFTGLLLAQAVSAKKARLEQPVAELLPGYVIPAWRGKPITLLDLATQTSGLPRLPDNMRPAHVDNPYVDYTAADLQTFLAAYQLTREPGTAYAYSNLGFGLLGQALAVQANKPYSDLIRERIAAPLGMTSTAVALSPAMRVRLAPGHDAQGHIVPNWDMDAMAGAGAVRSNAHDMLLYLQAMMRAEPGSAYVLARAPQRPADKNGGRIGLAWHAMVVRNTPVIWHNGMTGGYASFAGFTADGKRGVIVLTNSAVSVDNVALAALVPGATLEPQEVLLAPEVLSNYSGRYQLAPGFILTVRPDARGLVIQATGQGELPAFASAVDQFYVRAIAAPLSFQRDASGAVDSLVLVQNGRAMPARKMAATPDP